MNNVNIILMIYSFFIDSSNYIYAYQNEGDPEFTQFIKIQQNEYYCQNNNSYDNSLTKVTNKLNEDYCPKTFDGILCWDTTIKNKWVFIKVILSGFRKTRIVSDFIVLYIFKNIIKKETANQTVELFSKNKNFGIKTDFFTKKYYKVRFFYFYY